MTCIVLCSEFDLESVEQIDIDPQKMIFRENMSF